MITEVQELAQRLMEKINEFCALPDEAFDIYNEIANAKSMEVYKEMVTLEKIIFDGLIDFKKFGFFTDNCEVVETPLGEEVVEGIYHKVWNHENDVDADGSFYLLLPDGRYFRYDYD